MTEIAPPRRQGGRLSHSRRSGCSLTIRAYRGWNWNQPENGLPTILYACVATSGEISFKVSPFLSAASARSCTWHDRSMVMNHHTASSTVPPTVIRPWLCRIAALRLPIASAIRWPSSSSTATPPKSS